RLPRLLRRLRDPAGRRMATLPGPQGASRSRAVRLRPHPHAGGNRSGSTPLRRPLPGLAGGIHGMRRRRLRRLHRARTHPGRSGHETRVRRRPGIRRVDRVLNGDLKESRVPAGRGIDCKGLWRGLLESGTTEESLHGSVERPGGRDKIAGSNFGRREAPGPKGRGPGWAEQPVFTASPPKPFASQAPKAELQYPEPHPKLIFASRLARESALASASAISTRPSL